LTGAGIHILNKVIDHAIEIRMRAEIRAGRLLAESEKNKGNRN
jgi:hypothetical protein